MKRWLQTALLAAVVGGSAVAASPASAVSLSIGVNFPGVGFSYNSGGYCDSWGCPDYFWNYPIYYCPVYYQGRWYRGPVYYRSSRGGNLYWIHGGWRRDYWRDRRPYGACVDRFGPPLDLDFYIWNGFRVRDSWRFAWDRERGDWWRHRQDWDRRYGGDTRWRSWLPSQQQSYDWNRERNWSAPRDWTRRDWNRTDWERRNGIDRNRNLTPPVSTMPVPSRGGTVSPPPRTQPVITAPPANNPPSDNRDRFRGGRDRGDNGRTPRSQMAPAVAPPTNAPEDQGGRNRDRFNRGRERGDTERTPPSQMAPAATTPPGAAPADQRGRNRDRVRGGRDQGGEAAPPAPTNNSPADDGDNGRKKKDKRGRGAPSDN
jgi:hypothetical protein